MAKSYVESKLQKKKSSKKLLYLIVLIGIIFVLIVGKFAIDNKGGFSMTGLPTNSDAYSVSQDIIRLTVRSNNVNFPADGFQIGKRGDSVYVIRTSAELEDNGNKKNVSFKVLMQYKGGKQDDVKNWSLLDISEERN